MQEGDVDCLTPHPVRPPRGSTRKAGTQANQGQVAGRNPFPNVRLQKWEQQGILYLRHCRHASHQAERNSPRCQEGL